MIDEQGSERRQFKRSSHIACEILLSKDGIKWENVKVLDISAGGFRFQLNGRKKYEVGEQIEVQLKAKNEEDDMRFDLLCEVLYYLKEKKTYSAKYVKMSQEETDRLDDFINKSIELGMKDMVLWGPGKVFVDENGIK